MGDFGAVTLPNVEAIFKRDQDEAVCGRARLQQLHAGPGADDTRVDVGVSQTIHCEEIQSVICMGVYRVAYGGRGGRCR